MSSEIENTKNLSTETSKTSGDNVDDTASEDSQDKDVKIGNDEKESSDKKEVDAKVSSDKPAEAVEKKEKKESETKNEKSENHEENDKDEKDKKDENNESKTDNDTEEGEGSDKDDADKNDEKKGVPLLDQPLEQSGTRERKKVQRFNEDLPADLKEGKADVPVGTGVQLGEIPRIDASISRFKNDDLKLLHRLLYKAPGKTALIQKNIKKFHGFDFKKDSEEYVKKIDSTKKFELKQLKSICEMLDLEKKGVKDEIAERIVDFLLEPKDSGKPAGGGRPKRTAAVRANNRGYSSHDDSYSSDERRASRGGRGKGKRTNLKDDSTSESDSEFHPSDVSEPRPRVIKRKSGGRKKQDSEEDEDVSEVDESPTSEEMSDDEPKKRKKSKKVPPTNNKAKGKSTGRGRGRKPAAESEKKTPAPKKPGRKRDRASSEESEPEPHDEDNASSSEDEPLIKKTKSPQPPTDEEIKKYVKEILDGANLEEITMKTVCKQVYAHYPDFDLAHKKDFIKSTVKSLIST